MAGASASAANQALDGLTTPVNLLGFLNLNTTDPGTTGANESTATRQAATWNTAAARAKTNSSSHTFTTQSPSTAHSFASTWSLVSGGVNGMNLTLGSSVTAASITIAAGAISISA